MPHLNYLGRAARRAGRSEATGQMGDATRAWLQLARARALAAGCSEKSVAEVILDGLDEGRYLGAPGAAIITEKRATR